jgi:CHAD domain-containing protein
MKAKRVKKLDPEAPLAENAARIVRVRLSELRSFGPKALDPERSRDQHDMRIAAKRLRYVLEVTAETCFGPYAETALKRTKDLQDLLGEIHDRDVQVPMLAEHLETLRERGDEAARRLVAQEQRARANGAAASEATYRSFRRRLDAWSRADQRPGIEALLARRRRERDALYARFLGEWARLREDGFRGRLEGVLGI